MTNLGAPSSYS